MRTVHHYRELERGEKARRVVSIGNFDGVHIGHTAVLGRARREADERHCELAVLTFEPHPSALFEGGRPPLRLADQSQKEALLAARGVDVALFQRFDAAFAALSPESFASEVLVGSMHAVSVVVGEGFRFGAKRAGDFAALREFGASLGFSVIAAALVTLDGGSVSSTRIRTAILEGDLATAERLLGRPYEIAGEIVRGRGVGNDLGFPTINLGDVAVLLPPPGIYAARCEVNGETHGAALYVGDRPTLGHGFSIEAHLLDFEGDLYGARAALRLVERVRKEERFDGADALKRQMAIDVARIREILEGAT